MERDYCMDLKTKNYQNYTESVAPGASFVRFIWSAYARAKGPLIGHVLWGPAAKPLFMAPIKGIENHSAA
jgi:hypothetical protein